MRRALTITTLLLGIVALLARLDPLQQGLTATYFTNANWSSAPVRSAVEARPSTDALAAAWRGAPPETFSATWIGSLVTMTAGTYTFESVSDDGAWVYIDGRLVVDDGGRHAPRAARGAAQLERGVHEIFIQYFQDGGGYAFDLRWSIDGRRFEPVPTWALWARHAEFPRMAVSVLIRRALAALFWLWAGLAIAALLAAAAPAAGRALRAVWSDPVRRALAAIVIVSVGLNVIGIWWGVPNAWAGDELTPKAVLIALSHRFSSGWFDRYPPLLFYLLTIAYSPWLMLESLGWAALPDAKAVALLFIVGRLVSVAAGVGTLVAVYVSGARAFGRRAGLWAAAAMALTPMFVFYSKTANPEAVYVFWFAVALAFFLRALETMALRDIVLFSGCAAMSVCTKDQAYALFLTMPLLLVWRLRGFRDSRLWVGGAAAAAVFIAIQNIPLNAHGFLEHVRDVTGAGRDYRFFAPTLAGEASLLRLTAMVDARSWGWPLFAAGLAGVVVAARDRARRRSAAVLVLIAAAYYLGFIAVVLYVYDRYLLPVCVVQALFAGVALDRLSAGGGVFRWRRAVAVFVIAYSCLYAATVDALMVRDSRYSVEGWLQHHAAPDALVGTAFGEPRLPRMGTFHAVDIGTTENLVRWHPDFFVLNADYARAVAPHRPQAQLAAALERGDLNYRLVYRYRAEVPWPWLPAADADLVGARGVTPPLSFLTAINPTIEIFARESF